MEKFSCPLPQVTNPYYNKINALDTEILKSIIENITINKSNINYVAVNKIINPIDYNNDNDLKNIKNLNKQINNSTNNNYELDYKFKDYSHLTTTPLTEIELTKKSELIDKYKKEYARVLNIKLNFIENYINATILKKAHLSIKCGKRINTTSYCDIKDFLDATNNKTYNYTLDSIKEEYNKILGINNCPYQKINNSNIECCFIINKIYALFENYLTIIKYCIKLLETKPYLLREEQTFLFDIGSIKSYFYAENTIIYVNHMDTIFNIVVNENNTNIKNNFIKFRKTPKRNDVYFEDP